MNEQVIEPKAPTLNDRTKRPLLHRPLTACLATLLLVAGVGVGAGCGDQKKETGGERVQLESQLRHAIQRVDDRLGELLEREAIRRARTRSVAAILESAAGSDAKGEAKGEAKGREPLYHAAILEDIYKNRAHRPIWYESSGMARRLSEPGRRLADRLRDAVVSHGLWPDRMHLKAVREARRQRSEACCDGSLADLRLRAAERGEMLRALMTGEAGEGERPLSEGDRLAERLLALAVDESGPTPRLAGAVRRRVKALEERSRAAAAADVYLTDALVGYLQEMKWSNTAWHEGRGWHATLRLGERGPLRSGRRAGDKSDRGSAARQLGRAVEAARTDAFSAAAAAKVVEKPAEVEAAMDEAVPRFEQYERLTRVFARYRPVVERGGWPAVPSQVTRLREGYRAPAVATLKQRLRIEGYYEEPVAEEESDEQTFDAALTEAITEYQRTHQLWERGTVTKPTLRSMNVPAKARWNQIRVTLERWRDSRIGDDSHYVHVNIPDFHAEVWRDGARKMRFRVVTGSAKREPVEKDKKKVEEMKKAGEPVEMHFPQATPRFSDEIEYIVFNPYWNVPHGIWKDEIEPKLEENPDYYEENGYEVVVHDNGHKSLRQKAGPDNSLGKVKFLFPNEHSVYLHDTPAKTLFKRPTRAASHGCVRIENPMDFAHYLLDLDGRWEGEARQKRLDKWFGKEGETWLSLKKHLAVHLEYYVVRVDEQGRAHFLADPYDLDEPRLARVAEKLEAGPEGYDLERVGPEALMEQALAGRLAEPETPASPWASTVAVEETGEPSGPQSVGESPGESPVEGAVDGSPSEQVTEDG